MLTEQLMKTQQYKMKCQEDNNILEIIKKDIQPANTSEYSHDLEINDNKTLKCTIHIKPITISTSI